MLNEQQLQNNVRVELANGLRYFNCKYICINVFALLLSLYQFDCVPFLVPLIWCLISEFLIWKFGTLNSYQLWGSILFIGSYLYLLVIYYMESSQYAYYCIFLLLAFLLQVKQRSIANREDEYTVVLDCLKVFYSFSVFVAGISITFKLNGLVDWKWSQAFWWYWMFLSATIGTAFTVFMVVISKGLNDIWTTEDNTTAIEYKALLWIFLVATLSSAQSSVWIVNTFTLFELEVPVILGLWWQVSTTIITLLLFSIATQMQFQNLIQFFIQVSTEVKSEQNITIASPRKSALIGRFLKRLSSAYFRKASIRDQIPQVLNSPKDIMTERDANANLKTFRPITIQLENQPQITNRIPSQSADHQSNKNCLICFDIPPNAVLMNCGHGGICYQCAVDSTSKCKECFLCRQPVIEILEIENTDNSIVKVLTATKLS